jgi:predicted secreted protein
MARDLALGAALLLAAACRDAAPPPSPMPAASASSGSLADAGDTVVRIEDDGKTFDLARGATVTLELELSSGTGFSWVPTPADSGVLVQRGERTSEQTAASPKPGAPRLDVYRFVAQTPGAATIAMELRRPWETDTPPAKTFRVMIRVH